MFVCPKHMMMAEPEVAFHHAEDTEATHSCAQEWVQALYTGVSVSRNHPYIRSHLAFYFQLNVK